MFRRAKKTSIEARPPAEGLESSRVSTAVPQGVTAAPRNSDAVESTPNSGASSWKQIFAEGAPRPFVIPHSYTISGDVCTSRPVVVGGRFAGGVLKALEVVVLPEGELLSTARVDTLRVLGRVAADAKAYKSVEVAGRARVEGRIESPSMSVQPGANLSKADLVVGPRR